MSSDRTPTPGSALVLAERYSAHNYSPLPVELATADGAWVTDTAGRQYLDLLAGYSALNFGHRHPALLAAAHEQLDRLTLTARAFGNDQLGPFCRDLAELARKDRVLPMNTGAEAVETAIKVARKWGYEHKAVPPDRAKIVTCANNFHGRTTTIVGFSTEPSARDGFGPFAPGFVTIPYGDADLLEAAIDENTVGFLFEPIQGEAGVVTPPDGYLREVRRICSTYGVLMIADEVQSGLGRTGTTFACEHEHVVPDLYILGKALGGGIVPVSAVVGDSEILDVIGPGEHGSTFGGNPLAAAVGRAVVALLRTGEYQDRAARLGPILRQGIVDVAGDAFVDVRGRGLWIGADLHRDGPDAFEACHRLLGEGLLTKDTHGHTIRFSPPLCITEEEIDWAVPRIGKVLRAVANERSAHRPALSA